ncbi:MAG: PAS domain-containing sensor histidine kinase [Nitrospirota bacterium]|nr:PAS domain-containing sensor histidine kinase [Nitrospirota bacterium]MDH5767831.1 PAS domain-containing sensor histidine kinase [Nitrospirota bacterium]
MEKQQICQTITKNLPIGFTVLDKSGLIIDFNDTAQKITGYKKEDILGKSHLDIFHRTSDKNACPLLSQVIESHEQLESMESTIKSKDGNTLVLLITGVPILDDQGNLIGGVELFRDITVVKKLERERQYLLSSLVHDMKNPITTSLGFLSRIMAGKADKHQQKNYLELITEELQTVEHLITNFLDFATMEARGVKLKPASYNIAHAIKEQIENISIVAREKNIQIITEFSEDEFPEIIVDGAMINRVIVNLLDNAIKFTKIGGKVIVRLINRDKELLIEVEDTATSIPKYQLPYLFEPFYRGVRDQKGSGLGLFIAKTIIEAHGGKILVTSRDDIGNVFEFTLPK